MKEYFKYLFKHPADLLFVILAVGISIPALVILFVNYVSVMEDSIVAFVAVLVIALAFLFSCLRHSYLTFKNNKK